MTAWRLAARLRLVVVGLPLVAGCAREPRPPRATPVRAAAREPNANLDAAPPAADPVTVAAAAPARDLANVPPGSQAHGQAGAQPTPRPTPSPTSRPIRGPVGGVSGTRPGRARIVDVHASASGSELVVDHGRDHGLAAGDKGMILGANGRALARGGVVIKAVTARSAKLVSQLSLDQIRSSSLVVVFALDADRLPPGAAPPSSSVPGGRALTERGVTVVAALRGPLPENARARRWIETGLGEHAAVASFARAAEELAAVGAPEALVAATRRAGADEVMHARGCFALAARYAGAPIEPADLPPTPPRGGDLAAVARDTLLEGCIHETLSVLDMSERLRHAPAHEHALLDRIIEDESRHAELAWRTVTWALREGGESVREALRVAADEARATFASIPGFTEVVEPTLALLLA